MNPSAEASSFGVHDLMGNVEACVASRPGCAALEGGFWSKP
jgi:hypothetical protein